MQEVRKAEVEELLGSSITDSMFDEALSYAKKKQERIYQNDGREVVLQHWYLVKLTEECVRNLAFSEFTMDLCMGLHDMKKEYLKNRHSASKNNYIVAVPAGKVKHNVDGKQPCISKREEIKR